MSKLAVLLCSIQFVVFCNTAQAFLSHKVLGQACSAIRNIKIDPSCNPAFAGVKQEYEVFAANFYIGDNYEYFYKNRDLFSESHKKAIITEILTEKDPIGVESSGHLWWRQTSFVFGIEPMHLYYQSEVINTAYPKVYADAGFEQSLFFHYGRHVENTLFGIQFKFYDRQIVHEELFLFEALPDLDNYFKVQRQNVFLIEPAIAWDLSDIHSDWNPMLSARFSDLGFTNKKIESHPLIAQFDLGASVNPNSFNNNLEFALNYRVNTEKKFLDNLSVGSSFYSKWLQVYLGLQNEQQSIGFATRFRNWTSGMMVQRSKTYLSKTPRDTIFLEFRILI